MIINAYTAYPISSNKIQTISTTHVIKEMCDKLIAQNAKLIEVKNVSAIKKLLEASLVNDYNILNKEKIGTIINCIIDKIYGYGILEKYIKD